MLLKLFWIKKNNVWINAKNKWLYIQKIKNKNSSTKQKNNCWISFHIGRHIRHMNEKNQKKIKLKNHTMFYYKHDWHKKTLTLGWPRRSGSPSVFDLFFYALQCVTYLCNLPCIIGHNKWKKLIYICNLLL